MAGKRTHSFVAQSGWQTQRKPAGLPQAAAPTVQQALLHQWVTGKTGQGKLTAGQAQLPVAVNHPRSNGGACKCRKCGAVHAKVALYKWYMWGKGSNHLCPNCARALIGAGYANYQQ